MLADYYFYNSLLALYVPDLMLFNCNGLNTLYVNHLASVAFGMASVGMQDSETNKDEMT